MDDIIGIIAILCTIALPIAFGMTLGLISIKSEHRERMGLINQGIIPPERLKRKPNPNRYVSLRNGILLVAIGVGIIVGFVSANNLALGEYSEFWVIAASIVFFLGVGFLTYFLITRNMVEEKETEQAYEG